jgi:hypothetical protein
MVEAPGGFAQTYGVELLYETFPKISRTEIARCVKERCPGTDLVGDDEKDESLLFIHRDHLPAHTVAFLTDQPFKITEALTESLQQSWSFSGAADLVGRCRSTILVTDLMSSPLD